MHVVLATEKTDLRLSIELLLSEEPGVSIAGTASETEGLLALINSTKPEIVILDWMLPGRPAAGILAEAKKAHSSIKFIALAGRLEIADQARQAGADAVVVKGDPPERLITEFRRIRTQVRTSAAGKIADKRG